MLLPGWFIGVWGALTILHLIATAALIVSRSRIGTPEQLQSAVRQLSIDVEELFGAVEKWTKRRYAQEARERIGQMSAPSTPDPRDRKAYKAYLRAQYKGGNSS